MSGVRVVGQAVPAGVQLVVVRVAGGRVVGVGYVAAGLGCEEFGEALHPEALNKCSDV